LASSWAVTHGPIGASSPKLGLRVPQSAVELGIGEETPFEVSVVRHGESQQGPVDLTFEGVPPRLDLRPVTIPPGEDRARVAAGAAREDVAKSADVRVVASAGSLRAESSVRMTLRPSPAVGPRTRGDAHLGRIEFDRAIAAFREAVRLDASDADSARGLAHAL